MHDMLVKAIVFTNQKKTEGGGGLPGSNFQYDGTGTNKWFYIDVEQTSGGLLTWDNLGRALEGLLICAFHRHIHNEIYFEIWEMDNTEARDILQGIGYFGMLEPAAAVQ